MNDLCTLEVIKFFKRDRERNSEMYVLTGAYIKTCTKEITLG